VIWDRDFYDRSGGGLTVSGGEPMRRFEGLKELLYQAKTLGLHVCLDTCGQAPAQKYLAIRPFVDVFLFDYKVTDPALHKKMTSVDNRLILSNLRMLAETGSDLFLRCPIIPGNNDCEDHYRAIARLSEQYDRIRQVNLMFYHDMAKGKSRQIGQEYALAELKTMEETAREKIRKMLHALGCTKLREG
ncbi:MAG: radical SAM protein, partial [Lachnospiraceae bacterium]|nr:radical SAM protein [Lachnospiraceae bacterium]